MGRVEHGWLERKGGAWDKLCTYGPDGLYKETGRSSLPGLTLYRVVRYCGMGPKGGFKTAAEEGRRGYGSGTPSSMLASITLRASPDSGEVSALMIHGRQEEMQLLGAFALHYSKI